MNLNDFDYLIELPGEEGERRWLQERLETLSVREGIALAVAAQREPPEDMAQAINCLQSLDEYTIYLDVGSYKELGRRYLMCETPMPSNAVPFIDLQAVGKKYEAQHPGLFIGNCFVQYPKDAPQPVYQGQGSPLPEDSGWGVKLKITSSAVPEGVWLRLPGLWEEGVMHEDSLDETMALQELRAQCWDECTLLDAQCTLPEAGNLLTQYDDLYDLIHEGHALSCVLRDHGQGSPDFMERYAAALNLEHCNNLRFALNISRNLHCYDWIPCGGLEASAEKSLLDAGVSEELIRFSEIDLAGYKAHLLEEKGYTPTPDGKAYIKRNDEEFREVYYSATPEQSGMTMQ